VPLRALISNGIEQYLDNHEKIALDFNPCSYGTGLELARRPYRSYGGRFLDENRPRREGVARARSRSSAHCFLLDFNKIFEVRPRGQTRNSVSNKHLHIRVSNDKSLRFSDGTRRYFRPRGYSPDGQLYLMAARVKRTADDDVIIGKKSVRNTYSNIL